MKHLNHHIVCVVDSCTSGPRPGYNDIIELCVMPVTNGFQPDKQFLPFHMYMHPKRPENFDWSHLGKYDAAYTRKHLKDSLDPWYCQELFENWYTKLGLRDRKHIQPLAYNWSKQAAFLQDWFGYDDDNQTFMSDFFDLLHHRDLIDLALYMNDLAWCNQEPYPIQKQNLAYICNKLNIVQRTPQTCMSHCFDILSCWRELAYMKLPTGFELNLRLPVDIDYSAYQESEDSDD